MKKKNEYQVNLPIRFSKIANVRKLHNSRVHNIYLLQSITPLKHLVFACVPTKYKGVTPRALVCTIISSSCILKCKTIISSIAMCYNKCHIIKNIHLKHY